MLVLVLCGLVYLTQAEHYAPTPDGLSVPEYVSPSHQHHHVEKDGVDGLSLPEYSAQPLSRTPYHLSKHGHHEHRETTCHFNTTELADAILDLLPSKLCPGNTILLVENVTMNTTTFDLTTTTGACALYILNAVSPGLDNITLTTSIPVTSPQLFVRTDTNTNTAVVEIGPMTSQSLYIPLFPVDGCFIQLVAVLGGETNFTIKRFELMAQPCMKE